MKRIIIITFLFVAIYTPSFPRKFNYNQQLIDLLSAKKWLEADHYYIQHKDKITDEFTRLFYHALTSEIFNQPDSAIVYNQLILDKFKNSFTSKVYVSRFLIPYEQYCVDIQRFEKANELNETAIGYYRNDSTLGDSTSRAYTLKSLESFREFMKTLIIPNKVNEITDTQPNNIGEIVLETQNSGNSILINAEWNRVHLRTLFDTGCGNSAYIWNMDVAKKIGVKINYNDTILLNGNIKTVKGQIDSLSFGKFKVTNIPVYVNLLNVDKSDIKQIMCDSILNSKFDIVLGLPIIQQLGIMEIDREKKTMSFPVSMEYKNYTRRNMYINNLTLYLNMSVYKKEYEFPFDTGGFFGLIMNSDFYLQNKSKLKITTSLDDKHPHFTGGCNAESMDTTQRYKWTNAKCTINGIQIRVKEECEISPDKNNDYRFGTKEAGSVGNGIFKDCKKVVFDFDKSIFTTYK